MKWVEYHATLTQLMVKAYVEIEHMRAGIDSAGEDGNRDTSEKSE